MGTRPEAAGFSGEALGRIDAHLRARYLEPEKIAGALTLVHRRGELAWCSPLGQMDRERGKPMAEDTIFRIYSMTKPVASLALMQLYERGHFQLDDPVHKFIPSWRRLRVYAGGEHPDFETEPCERPVTVRHLLTHQSGLTYGFMARTPVDAAYRELGIGVVNAPQERSLEEAVELLADLPLEFQPGAAWNYSVSTDVVGRLVEVFSGERLDDYLRRHVFGPLSMVDTDFHVPDEKLPRFAANYYRRRKKLTLLDDPEKSSYRRPPAYLSGGGGLVSTAADYLRFCRMLLGGGELEGTRLLSRKTLELMTRNHLAGGRTLDEANAGAYAEIALPGNGFGLGFSVTLDPVRAGVVGSPGEFAWGGAASTVFWVDPAEDLIVLFLTQLYPSGTFNFRGQLKALVYGALAG